jgi:hypothetical protein
MIQLMCLIFLGFVVYCAAGLFEIVEALVKKVLRFSVG